MSNPTTHARRARRGAVAFTAMALVAAGLGATTAAAAPPADRGPHTQRVLPERARGEAAIQALGGRLPEVAAWNGTTADELARRLRSDQDLWVDTTGILLFVDEGLQPGEPDHDHAEPPAAGALDPSFDDRPTAEAFTLHSRPGAPRVIYLDFDGHTTPGGGWNGTAGQPYDLDGNPSTFSETERQVIIDTWRHVAEDFAPFDIDVTTEEPPVDAIRRTTSSDAQYGTRVVVSPNTTDCTGCGGIAYVGTFDIHGGSASTGWTHDHYQPAWVYIAGSNAKHIAEAASHEAGHNLGLSHDGVTGGSSYYSGHGDWAPIMGVGYYRPISQWSRGEYAGASNTEDDFAVIAANGGTSAGDDHGGTPATATPLATGPVDVTGVLGSRTDLDAFSFTTGGGVLSLQATGARIGPDADLALRLLDGSGTTLHLVDPPGLSATLDVTLAAGIYTVVVDGVGAGDPATTGYSDYASVGRYRLTGVVPTGDPVDDGGGSGGDGPTAPPGSFSFTATTVTTSGVVTIDWTDSSGATSYAVLREQKHAKTGKWVSATSLGTVTDTVFSESPPAGTYRYTVTAQNDLGTSSATTGELTVTGSSTGGGGKGGKGKAQIG